MLKLSNDKLRIVENNLDDLNQFKSYFGKKWFHKEMNTDNGHHPILFLLFDKKTASDLIDKLKILESRCDKFRSIIRKLKYDRDFNNFYSTLTEIDVISYYYQGYNSNLLEYEPPVQSGKKLDLRMSIDGEDYFFEILTVFQDSEQEKYSYIREKITQELEGINLPFIINLRIREGFKKEHITNFVNFIENTIKEEKPNNLKYEFYNDNKLVADFRYYKYDGNVCIVNSFGPSSFINPHGRLRAKVLKKAIEQIPNNQNNIVVVNLSYVLNIFIVMEQALGELGIQIDENDNLNDKYYRIQNGIFDYKDSSHISMIIAYINNDYNQRRFYLNHKLDDSGKEKLLKIIDSL